MDEKAYWIGFSVFPGVGPKTFSVLLSRFTTAHDAWFAKLEDLTQILGEKLATTFVKHRDTFSLASFLEKLEVSDIETICLFDSNYPMLLKELASAPFVLFAKGNTSLLQESNMVAIVGTRKMTEYGKQVTVAITKELVQHDSVIVSGLAFGIDSVAHDTAVTNHGKTVAVLGCGVDCCTPSSNQRLYDQIIASNGLIISESPFGAASFKGVFPSRNRIIAGMSQAVVVTEGAQDSGALITAKRAVELDRKVFAVPGPITTVLSTGPNKLIQDGAIPVVDVRDILRVLGIDKNRYNRQADITFVDPTEEAVFLLLQRESLHFDEIVRRLEKDSANLAGILSVMELKGIVHSVSGGKYAV